MGISLQRYASRTTITEPRGNCMISHCPHVSIKLMQLMVENKIIDGNEESNGLRYERSEYILKWKDPRGKKLFS